MTDRLDDDDDVLYEGQVAVVQTDDFRDWLNGLRDRKARIRIYDRLMRLARGHAGDAKLVGDGLLFNGGSKGSQSRDIAKAKRLAREAEDGLESHPL